MINEITIQGTTYGIEPDDHGGDIILLSEEHDICIEGGYTELKDRAIQERGYLSGDDVEISKSDEEYYIETHIEDYISQNFSKGIVIVND